MSKDAKLKSMFVIPALTVTALLFAISLLMIVFAAGYRLSWVGAALAALPWLLLTGRLIWRPVARTSEHLPLHLLATLAGVILACQGMYGNFVTSWGLYQEFPGALVAAFNPSAANLPGLVAIICAVLFFLYVFWYSRFGRYGDARLDVGSKLPDFNISDLNGQTVRSTEFLGQPAVFLFYSGNWCPLCVAQIDELRDRHDELRRLGIVVCLISPQPANKTASLAERHDVEFRFLVDEGNAAARSLGIALDNGVPLGVPGDYPAETVMPTMFVTTAGGTIVFSDQTDNTRVRPEPDIFLAILRRAGVAGV